MININRTKLKFISISNKLLLLQKNGVKHKISKNDQLHNRVVMRPKLQEIKSISAVPLSMNVKLIFAGCGLVSASVLLCIPPEYIKAEICLNSTDRCLTIQTESRLEGNYA